MVLSDPERQPIGGHAIAIVILMRPSAGFTDHAFGSRWIDSDIVLPAGPTGLQALDDKGDGTTVRVTLPSSA